MKFFLEIFFPDFLDWNVITKSKFSFRSNIEFFKDILQIAFWEFKRKIYLDSSKFLFVENKCLLVNFLPISLLYYSKRYFDIPRSHNIQKIYANLAPQ